MVVQQGGINPACEAEDSSIDLSAFTARFVCRLRTRALSCAVHSEGSSAPGLAGGHGCPFWISRCLDAVSQGEGKGLAIQEKEQGALQGIPHFLWLQDARMEKQEPALPGEPALPPRLPLDCPRCA